MENQTVVKEMYPTTTQEWIQNGALFVDVREKNEIEALSYSVLKPILIKIPTCDFENRSKEIPKEQDVVMECTGGGRNISVAGFVVIQGYSNVVNTQNGSAHWVQKGFSTKGNTTTMTGDGSCCPNSACC
jgi:rhodanese-related sulfurtransferase